MKFFSHTLEGFQLHHTLEEARKAAADAFEADRETAAEDGWSDDVHRICWGPLGGRVVEISRQEQCLDDTCDQECGGYHGRDFDAWVDYALEDYVP